MAIITLMTDWGISDFYIGAMKGTLLRLRNDLTIVDITHCISKFDFRQAAFILRNAYPSFPEGTIHIIGVNTEESLDIQHVVVKADGQYFIAADNNILSLVFEEKEYEAVSLDIPLDNECFTFSSRDRFAKAAIMLSNGASLADMGKPYKLKECCSNKPAYYKNNLGGSVIYIDDYGNAITNISKEMFDRYSIGKSSFVITFSNYKTKRISKGYLDVQFGHRGVLFGSHGFLEIFVNQANASDLLGLSIDSRVNIEYFDEAHQE